MGEEGRRRKCRRDGGRGGCRATRGRIWANASSRRNEVDLRLARDGRSLDLEMLVLDLGAVPCCESHERMERAVRGTGKEGGGDREAPARTSTGPVALGGVIR